MNENDIADGWEKEHGIYKAVVAEAQAQAEADDEAGPDGNENDGDGWSVYDEYRGLYTTTDEKGDAAGHVRLDPNIKNIMYTSHANVQKYGTGALPAVEKHSFTHVDHRLYQKDFDPFTNIYVYDADSGQAGHIATVDPNIGRVNYNSNPKGATRVPGALNVWSIRIKDNEDDDTDFNRYGNATPGSPSQYSLAVIFTDKIEERIDNRWETNIQNDPNVKQSVKDAKDTHSRCTGKVNSYCDWA